MQVLKEIPKDAENFSMWLAIRESGSVTQAVLVDGVLHAGSSSEDLDTIFGDGEYDPVMLFVKLIRPTDL